MKIFLTLIFFFFTSFYFSQISKNDTIRVENLPKDSIPAAKSPGQVIQDIEKVNAPLSNPKYSPTRAGLYSAVLPGLGQFYNKKIWKIPIVLGAIGTGVGIVLWNQKQYKRYRSAFIAELNGQTHEFSDIPGIDKNVLGNVQDAYKRQRDYAIAISSLVYILNIVDAVVDAHLYEGRKDPDLAIKPTIIYDDFGKQSTKTGVSLSYRF